LTHRRALFAGVDNFWLYDFFTPNQHAGGAGGFVNEDVFAFSNRMGEERTLVIYHNKYAETRGWIKSSAASMDKASGTLIQKTLAEALSLPFDPYVIFKDYVTGLEYIRSCQELTEKGLYVELAGYQCHVFLDWHFESGAQWGEVNRSLAGAGTVSIQDRFAELFAPKAEVKAKPSARKTKAKRTPGKTRAKIASRKSPGKETITKTVRAEPGKKKST
jgi:hypothetical protein